MHWNLLFLCHARQLKSEQFWRATGQSNLANRMEDCSISHIAVLWEQGPNFGSFCCGRPEFFTFSYCAWLWNWLFGDFQVAFGLCFKASPSAKPFIWKLVLLTRKFWFICMWIKLISTSDFARTCFETEAKGDSQIAYWPPTMRGNAWTLRQNKQTNKQTRKLTSPDRMAKDLHEIWLLLHCFFW